MTPRYSVVIPTRNRSGTIGSCLRTVLALPDGDLEVVVHDNSTSDETARIVEGISDPRVRYRRVHGLAMTDNWEAAVSSASGEWITVLGDDDGLMPFALDALRSAGDAVDTGVISWRKAKYCWPDRDRDRGKLKIPAPRSASWIDSRRQFALVLEDPRNRYGDLPMLYNSFVRRSQLELIRRPDGRLLDSRAPDVYSGAALALRMPRFLRVGIPLTMNGLSGSSNGVNTLTRPAGSGVAEDYAALNQRAGHAPHPAVPEVRSLAGAALESCLKAIDALAPDAPVDRFAVIVRTVEDALLFDAAEVAAVRAEAIRVAGNDRRLRRRVEGWLRSWAPRMADEGPITPVRPRFTSDAVQIDGTRIGISDIAAAVDFGACFYLPAEEHLIPGRTPNGDLVGRLRRAGAAVKDALRPPRI